MPASNLDPDSFADRRGLRRKVSFWRIAAILALILLVAALAIPATGEQAGLFEPRRHIARVSVSGLITTDTRMREMIERLGKDQDVAGVVVAINSPGGTTSGAEELYRALRGLAERKPIVAFVEGTAASGAYIAAIASDHIVARETSIVGSIGVLVQVPNIATLLERLGVDVAEIKSSPLKAAPSPVNPVDPAAIAALQSLVDDTFLWFRDLVGERRPIEGAALAAVSDGRVHTGRQSIGLGLVDALGDERTAIAWLESARGVAADLPVRNWEPRRRESSFDLLTSLSLGAALVGEGEFAAAIRQITERGRVLQLDGLLALWQPDLEN